MINTTNKVVLTVVLLLCALALGWVFNSYKFWFFEYTFS